MANIRIELAGTHQVDGVFPLVADGLERACRKTGGDLSAEYLWSECRAGRAFLFVIADEQSVIGASVWQFQTWITGKKLKCLCLYGRRMAGWLSQHQRVAFDLARVGGASAIVTDGRVGWARVFPKAKILRQTYEVEIGP